MELLTVLVPFVILVVFWLFMKRELRMRSNAPTRAEFEELQAELRQLRGLIRDQ